jgi:histidinol dehydrogenase
MPLQEPTNLEQLICDIMRELRSCGKQIVERISTKFEEVFAKTIQEIKRMQKWLYENLLKKLDGMTKLCFKLHHQQVPCNVFFTTGGTKQQHRLVDRFMGIETVYLHFLCEDIDAFMLWMIRKVMKLGMWRMKISTKLPIWSLLVSKLC